MNETENKHIMENINKAKSCYFEKSCKTDKHLV